MNLFRPLTALLLLAAPLATTLRAEDLPRAKAIEEDAVRALIGKKSIITGTVTAAFESPKGMTFLNLEGGKFTIVAWKESYEKFEGGSPAKLYKGKNVEVTGQVFEFRPKGASKDDPGKLEIKLTSPDQVKILTPEAAPKPEDAGKKDDAKEAPDQKAPDPKKPAKEADAKPNAKPDTKTDANSADAKPGAVDPKKYFK